MEDRELVQGCLEKISKCESDLYKKYYPLMISIALRYCKDEDTAVHEINLAYWKVLKSLKNYNPHYSIATWIRNIFVNHYIDLYRKSKKKSEEVHLDTQNESSYIKSFSYNTSEDNWGQEELIYLLKLLPNATQNVFNLFAIEGYSHAEISKILDISIGTSKWHLNSSREKLRELMNIAVKSNRKKKDLVTNE